MTVYTVTRDAGDWTIESVSNDGSPPGAMHLSSDEQMIDFVRGITGKPGRCEVRVSCDQDAAKITIQAA